MSKNKTTLFVKEEMKLRWPLKGPGTAVTVLALGLVLHADHAAVLAANDDETKIFAEFARLSCGLTAEQVGDLKTPDWNKLRLKLSDLVAKPSSFFFQRAGIAFDADAPLLLHPITSDTGELITEIELQVPSVSTTELMKKQLNAEARSTFITMSCTGLSATEISRLSCPDWNHLQERINSFLNETADFFPAETSTSSPT